MPLILMILLGSGLAETTDAIPRVEVITGGLYEAPRVSPLPWDLLPSAENRDGGVWLPLQLNMAMARWWSAYIDLSNLFQVQLDQLEEIEASSWEQGIELGEARERHRHAVASLEMTEDDGNWSDVLMTVLYVAGVVVAVGTAFAAGWMARGLAQ